MKHVKVFNENLVAVELSQKSVNFNKPIYVGFAVLELSKIRMYDFHYNLMKKKFNGADQLKLCYMDTDSFIYFIKTDDYYEDMKETIHQTYPTGDIHIFDTSNYNPQNAYGYQLMNKKVLGAMKDETAGVPMTVFIGLRSKAYYYEVDKKGGTKKAKGVVRKVADSLNIDDYLYCLNDPKARVVRKMPIFRSDHHAIFTEIHKKVALNAADDKRVILNDGIATLAYGNFLLVNDFDALEADLFEAINNEDYTD